MKILIVNSIGIQVVSSMRSLRSLGHEISIAIPMKNRIKRKYIKEFFYPKGIKNIYYISSPQNKNKFNKELINLVKNNNFDVILPFGFETTVAISAIKSEVLHYTNTSVADFELIQKVHDKEVLNQLLDKEGFLVPKIHNYDNYEDLKKIDMNFPVVVKARKGCGIDKGVRYANNTNELEKYYLEIADNKSDNLDLSDYSKPMIQEYVPGKIYDGCFVCNRGEIVASLLQIRDVTYPLSGGVGVNIITLEDEKLLDYCTSILKFLKWHGPCQVEVKKDSRTGEYKLIEINPKLWGTLGLSIYAGIDFSLKACEVAIGKIEKQTEYKIGLKYKILFPLEIYTLYQDKGKRLKKFFKLFEVFKKNVKTEFSIFDLKPNIYSILITSYTLIFKRTTILPKGKEFFNEN